MIRLISWVSVMALININVCVFAHRYWYKPLKQSHVEAHEAAELRQFTLKAMNIAPVVKLSETRQMIVANKVVEIVMKNIPTRDARESYISMLKIESNFDNTAKSPASAVGIGQIIPSTFKSAAEQCGLKVSAEDIANEDINLQVGSCYYNRLLLENQNNPRLAAIAYNGGQHTVEKFKKLANINEESANYGLKMEHVQYMAKR